MNIIEFIENEHDKQSVGWYEIHQQFESEHLSYILGREGVNPSDISADAKLWSFYDYAAKAVNSEKFIRLYNSIFSVSLEPAYDILVGKDATIYEYNKFMNFVIIGLDRQLTKTIYFEMTGLTHDGAVWNRSPIHISDFRDEYFL